MLCSKCKKNKATIFINEPTENDPNHLVGYCNNCAKDKGILSGGAQNLNNVNPLNMDLNQMASQFGVIFKDLSNNLNSDNINIENIDENGNIPLRFYFWNVWWTCLF